LGRHRDHRLEPGVIPTELRELFCVAERGRVGECPLDFVGAGEGGR
jgi:hypothetical protein